MAIRLRRPGSDDLARLLAQCPGDSLTYSPLGGALDGVAPPGLDRHFWATALPDGSFARGADAIRAWAVHRGAGLDVVTDGPMAVGTNVALSAPLPIGFVEATCRVIGVVDEPDRFGFAYGTLSVHPETGEEAFLVLRDGDATRFEVHAV